MDQLQNDRRNVLHGTGGGITLHIEKEAEADGELKVYIYLIMDAQLNIQKRAFISAVHLGKCW